MFKEKTLYCLLIMIAFLSACSQKKDKTTGGILPAKVDVNLLHNNQRFLNSIIIHDVFTPPVAARIYVYTSLAAYEAVRFAEPGYPSITAQLKGFGTMPEPDKAKKYNYLLAASKAFITVQQRVTFSADSIKKYEAALLQNFKATLDDETYANSLAFGEAIGKTILKRAATDNYSIIKGKQRFYGSEETGKWQPTPPDYTEAVEPYWNKMKCFIMDTCSQFMPPRPPAYSLDKASTFNKNLMEVFAIGKNITGEQKKIARYWDDNPFVMEHTGHAMFANKKITPGGHWMGITAIACKKSKAGMVKTAQAYALTAIALMEGFIACWDEKFRSNVVRPVTVIQEVLSDKWEPFLQTPPFPEYPSGHSTVSAAAATVLTSLFGDHFSFHDDSDKEYIAMEKDFPSFFEAANEASISRVYGGIHYRSAVEAGAAQGKQLGAFIIKKIRLTE